VSRRAKASNLDQLSAAVRAIEAKARIAGLVTTKIEQKVEIGIYSDLQTEAEAAAELFMLNGVSDLMITGDARETVIALLTVRVALMFNPATAVPPKIYMPSIQAAASTSGVEVNATPVHAKDEIEGVIAAQAREQGSSLLVMPVPSLFKNRRSRNCRPKPLSRFGGRATNERSRDNHPY
jgi:hypothetical protein